MQIQARLMSGEVVGMEVASSDNLSAVRANIADRKGVQAEQVALFHGSTLLCNTVKVGELESPLHVDVVIDSTTSWLYTPCNYAPLGIRKEPQIEAAQVSETLKPGDSFKVLEELRDETTGVLYLKLADGRGWAFDFKPSVGKMCVRSDDFEHKISVPKEVTGSVRKAGQKLRQRHRARGQGRKQANNFEPQALGEDIPSTSALHHQKVPQAELVPYLIPACFTTIPFPMAGIPWQASLNMAMAGMPFPMAAIAPMCFSATAQSNMAMPIPMASFIDSPKFRTAESSDAVYYPGF